MMRILAYDAANENYKVIAEERMDALMTISTTMTHEMLLIDKI